MATLQGRGSVRARFSRLAPTVAVATLQAGDLQLKDVVLPVVAPRVLEGVDGILGVEGLGGLRLDVDFTADRLRILRPEGRRTRLPTSTAPWRSTWTSSTVFDFHKATQVYEFGDTATGLKEYAYGSTTRYQRARSFRFQVVYNFGGKAD